MAAADRDAAAAMVQMRRAEARPMTELMTSWSSMWGDPEMGFMVGLGVDVPLDVRALRARREAADAALRAADAQVAVATAGAALDADRAGAAVAEMAAMETLMATRMAPLSAEAVRLARQAYETNRGTLDAWLTAERDDAQTARRLLQTRTERRQMEAMLAMARGQLAGLPDEPGASR
jgi:outer membrane protein TolC